MKRTQLARGLKLSRETIRSLSSQVLRQVQGGTGVSYALTYDCDTEATDCYPCQTAPTPPPAEPQQRTESWKSDCLTCR